VLLVGQAHRVPKPPEGGVLEMGSVDDENAPRPRDARELVHERLVVGHVLQHVDDHHPVELGVGEGERLAAFDADDVGRHQLADGKNRLLGEVGRAPAPAAAAQQQAHHPVVRAQVEAAQPVEGPQRGDEGGELLLLHDGAAEERLRGALPIHGARSGG
jgi:hypothetical protein